MSRLHSHSPHFTSDKKYICSTVLLFPTPADSKSRKEKLEQVASFSLFGNVMSMASVQLVGANRDALLLSFKDAKVLLCKLCDYLGRFFLSA